MARVFITRCSTFLKLQANLCDRLLKTFLGEKTATIQGLSRGQTGNSIVDAGMRQLWQTGWRQLSAHDHRLVFD